MIPQGSLHQTNLSSLLESTSDELIMKKNNGNSHYFCCDLGARI
jgi:hypothetical protein